MGLSGMESIYSTKNRITVQDSVGNQWSSLNMSGAHKCPVADAVPFWIRRITIKMNIKWTITLPPKIMEVKNGSLQ